MITYAKGMSVPYALKKLEEIDSSISDRIEAAIRKMARLEIFRRDNGETLFNLISPDGGFDSWKLNGGKPVRLYRYAVDEQAAPAFSHYCFAQYGIEASWRKLPDGSVEYSFYADREQAKLVVDYVRDCLKKE